MRTRRVAQPWLLLALLVAFSGTPCRLVELASDLARSTAGPQDEGAIGEVDGGVGDDAGETIRADVADDSPAGSVADLATGLVSFTPASRPTDIQRAVEPCVAFRPDQSRLHLRLQRILC